MEKFIGKNILVIGLGVSGYAAAELLAKRGFRVKVTDGGSSDQVKQRAKILRNKYQIEIEYGGHSCDFCVGADLVIVSPGVDLGHFYDNGLLKNNITVMSELELGYKFCCAPIVAITGTNGKTTTTELIGEILEKNGSNPIICGNIGNPLSGEIDRIDKESIVVLEVSSFQLEYIKDFCPYIGVLLNVSEDHYDRHGGYAEYKNSKFNLFKNQTENCWAVLFSDLKDDPCSRLKSNVLFFGKGEVCSRVDKTQVVLKDKQNEELVIDYENIRLEGVHNRFNIAAVLIVSMLLGVPDNIVKNVISSFVPPLHRFQKLGSINGVEFIDDSKATNIDATRFALESVDKKVILIAGGKDKGGDYSLIGELIRDKVKKLILIGEASDKMRQAYDSFTSIIEVGTMDQAVSQAFQFSEEGDVVMLSPMCSSFDMFSSYKHRGEVYQEAVKKLKKQPC